MLKLKQKPLKRSITKLQQLLSDAFAEVMDARPTHVAGIPNPAEELSRGGFGGMRFAYRFDPQAKPPPGYICHRCDRAGHFIRFCPTNDDPNFNFRRIKPATGIPVSFMRPADELLLSGAATMAQRSFAATEHVPGPQSSAPAAEAQGPALRRELLCPLCTGPLVNAVMAVCCFATFCDVCVRGRIGAAPVGPCPNWFGLYN